MVCSQVTLYLVSRLSTDCIHYTARTVHARTAKDLARISLGICRSGRRAPPPPQCPCDYTTSPCPLYSWTAPSTSYRLASTLQQVASQIPSYLHAYSSIEIHAAPVASCTSPLTETVDVFITDRGDIMHVLLTLAILETARAPSVLSVLCHYSVRHDSTCCARSPPSALR